MPASVSTVAAALLAVLAVVSPLRIRAEDSRPPALRDVGIEQRLDSELPLDAPLRDESGAAVKLGDYFGRRPVIFALVYYKCPMLCTLTLNGLVSSLRTLSFDAGQQFDVVAVSFNPDETPELAAAKKKTVLDEYRRPGAEKGWHFLTGNAESIARIAAAAGFRFKRDEQSGEFAHAAAIMVATPGGRLARYFYGVEYAPRDVRFALIEAAESRIGSVVDQLLLFCYRYDPHSARYTAAVMNLVRVSGVLTALGLGTFMVVFWRRDARAAVRPAKAGPR
jgi:protein SCO1/2